MLFSGQLSLGVEPDDDSLTQLRLSPPLFENDSANFSNSGSIKISWRLESTDDPADSIGFELQRATEPEFADAYTYYRGPDLATYISGLTGGGYFYRVRTVGRDGRISNWSTPIEVKVEHHSLSLAFTLFGLGAVVFILTLGVVIRGAAITNPEAGN